MRRSLVAITLLATAALLAAGCGGGKSPSSSGGGTPASSSASSPATSASPGGGGTAVTIDNFAFSPASVNVKVGQQVTWTNKQGVDHTVTADGGAFDQAMPSGATFSFTFTKAGTFPYHCNIHPSMHGTVVVA